jgi:hypothetical protein|tara:strand:+ start:935 stop:1408 length:474 start_codon:yes stop_codon:yes gene_type:complete
MDLPNMLMALDNLSDYDMLTFKLKEICLVSKTKEMYPLFNPKLLLSTVMITKHGNEMHMPEELQTLASDLWKNMMIPNACLDSYEKFVDAYLEWRTDDINDLKSSIEGGIESLSCIKENNEKDYADEQWNVAIDTSINVMKDKLGELEIFSKSPPSK